MNLAPVELDLEERHVEFMESLVGVECVDRGRGVPQLRTEALLGKDACHNTRRRDDDRRSLHSHQRG